MEIIADIMLPLMMLTIIAAIALTAFSVIRSARLNRRDRLENGVPVRMIGAATVAGVLLVAVPMWVAMSFADMCIVTAGVLMVAACGAVAFSKFITIKQRRNVDNKA